MKSIREILWMNMLLVKKGNIGIYNSCEVNELVIMEPSNKIYKLNKFHIRVLVQEFDKY